MALAERAELVARLSLKDDFSGKLRGVEGRMRSLGTTAKRVGKGIGIGLGAGLAVGTALTVRAVKSGIDSLTELEDATTSVDGAIKQMGITGQVTSGQIAAWANEIEAATQAAFDDKAITQAATTLLRYGKVAPQSLKETLTVMTDLAAKTGSVESAATKLAKSLADPTKATRVLREVGVTLTEAQQKQIKVWVESGKLGKAQALILKEVAKQVGGAAAAMNGPMRDAQLTLADVTEDASRALATGFLPVLMEVRDILSKELAKPSTLARIKEFGQSLAGGVRGLLNAAKGIDWDAIGTSLKIAGKGAKAVYDAFMGMPDWVKTAVLTGWGLNKLTGGALGDLVGTGLEVSLKGIVGQFFARGSSPINPMWVQSVAGVGPPGPPLPGGNPFTSVINSVATTLAAVVPPLLIAADAVDKANKLNDPNAPSPLVQAGQSRLFPFFGPEINVTPGTPGGGKTQPVHDTKGASLEERDAAYAVKVAQQQRDKIEAMRIALVSKIGGTTSAINTSKTHLAGKLADDKAAVVSAIKNNKPVVNVNVKVNTYQTTKVRVYQTGGTVRRSGSGSGPGGPVDPSRL